MNLHYSASEQRVNPNVSGNTLDKLKYIRYTLKFYVTEATDYMHKHGFLVITW